MPSCQRRCHCGSYAAASRNGTLSGGGGVPEIIDTCGGVASLPLATVLRNLRLCCDGGSWPATTGRDGTQLLAPGPERAKPVAAPHHPTITDDTCFSWWVRSRIPNRVDRGCHGRVGDAQGPITPCNPTLRNTLGDWVPPDPQCGSDAPRQGLLPAERQNGCARARQRLSLSHRANDFSL